jgi:hypothetical protein
MQENIQEEFKAVYQDGRFINLEALARKLKLSIIEKGGALPTNEDEVLTVLGAWDMAAHETDSMETERLGQFIEEFLEAWDRSDGSAPAAAAEVEE